MSWQTKRPWSKGLPPFFFVRAFLPLLIWLWDVMLLSPILGYVILLLALPLAILFLPRIWYAYAFCRRMKEQFQVPDC